MNRSLLGPLTAEAVGSFLFFFVGAGAIISSVGVGADSGLVGIALAHGLVLGVLVSALGAVSGAHFNPAVTLGVWIAGRIELTRGVLYIVAQLVGGLVAGLALRAVFPESMWQPARLGTPTLNGDFGVAAGIAVEAILTMVLLFAVFGTAIDPRAPKIGGLAIGLAVGADILMGGPITGAAMNPARWFGPALAGGYLENWYVWIIGPAIGAIVAAAIYRGILAEDADLTRTPASPQPS
jgi:MIP family channel proteins